MYGLVQTKPVQTQNASLGFGPVRPNGWTRPYWAPRKYGSVWTGAIIDRHFAPFAQQLDLTDEFGIPLTKGWAAAALLQFRDKAAEWANHWFLEYACTGLAWGDFSASVKEGSIPPDAVIWMEWNSDSLRIKIGKHVSTCDECFRVLRH